ncbi:BshB3 potential contributor to bacillithiol synthesis [Thalassorhabdus alkalitolerans]|uniref:BshB3 potential contributor to bacillithiol synthesis n=1 Tax=Thalassorhabdus alkalitolerans TaxID=2282697 RepID=A0ABW0YFR2_9BACI|nr:hypothetical protein [Thalassobacillus sp. C254]
MQLIQIIFPLLVCIAALVVTLGLTRKKEEKYDHHESMFNMSLIYLAIMPAVIIIVAGVLIFS